MVCRYDLEQTKEHNFKVLGVRIWKGNPTRADYKNILRSFAIDWQQKASELNYSYGDLSDWQSFFEEYGRKFGLLREFKENGII